MSNHVSAGTKAVAIKGCANDAAIGEGDGCRAIPRLHQASVVFIEGALIPIHVRVPGPRLGNQHGHDMRQTASGLYQQLDSVVEIGGVAAVRCNDRENLFDIIAEQR